MFDRLGRFAVAHPRKIVLCWVALAGLFAAVAPSWDQNSQDDDIRSMPADSSSARAHALMSRAFPSEVSASRMILAVERPQADLTGADFALVDRMTERLRGLRPADARWSITGVFSYRDGPVGERLVSPDRRCTLIQVAFDSPYLALRTSDAVDHARQELAPLIDEARSEGLSVFATGPAAVGRDLVRASARSLDDTTAATVVLVVAILLFLYRSVALALVPLVTIGLAVWVSLNLLSIATLIPGAQLANVSRVFAVVILFGAGTDYCVFLIGRYRENLRNGHPPRWGLSDGVGRVGGALAASAGTTICGLAMMGAAEFSKIRCAGPVIALSLAVGLAAALTLTPALLRLAGHRAVRPRRRSLKPGRGLAFWEGVSRFVVRRPGRVFALALAPLLPLAVIGQNVRPTFEPTGDLHPSAESVRGLGMIRQHFPAGETGPLTVLLDSDQDWDTPQGRELIDLLSAGFALLPNVAEVRSLTRPLGQPEPAAPAEVFPPADTGGGLGVVFRHLSRGFDFTLRDLTREAARRHYVSTTAGENGPRSVTRLDVIFRSDPFDPASVETYRLIETWTRNLLPSRTATFGEVRPELFGVTAQAIDLAAIVERDRTRVNALVLGGVMLILIGLVRRVWLASYLMATVLLSYYATLGATALFASWAFGQPVTEIAWRVSFFLFVILVAVGQDYNILLVTRILEEKREHGLIEGIRRGLAATGGTITACGTIMAGTFATLMLAGMATLVQVGFALALGVLLDTFLVRPFLVPSFIALVWREVPPEPAEILRLPEAPAENFPRLRRAA